MKAPKVSGVYAIRCVATGKVYVGSAVDIQARWDQHRYKLRRRTHGNAHLQNAWDKYDEECFEFSVLELVPRESLLEAEQKWIDTLQCADPRFGFNLYATAGSPGDAGAQTWEGFIDPDGKEVTITNLHEFCRQHGLNARAMMALANPKHKLRTHHGWTHVGSPAKRAYIKTWEGFVDPDGNEVAPITNLKAFCREHGLDATHMVAVLKGRICSHHGWTHRDGRKAQREKIYTGFISPEGQRVTITNLAAFCREHGLQYVHMQFVKSGKRKQHKGWTWREEETNE